MKRNMAFSSQPHIEERPGETGSHTGSGEYIGFFTRVRELFGSKIFTRKSSSVGISGILKSSLTIFSEEGQDQEPSDKAEETIFTITKPEINIDVPSSTPTKSKNSPLRKVQRSPRFPHRVFPITTSLTTLEIEDKGRVTLQQNRNGKFEINNKSGITKISIVVPRGLPRSL